MRPRVDRTEANKMAWTNFWNPSFLSENCRRPGVAQEHHKFPGIEMRFSVFFLAILLASPALAYLPIVRTAAFLRGQSTPLLRRT